MDFLWLQGSRPSILRGSVLHSAFVFEIILSSDPSHETLPGFRAALRFTSLYHQWLCVSLWVDSNILFFKLLLFCLHHQALFPRSSSVSSW